MRISESKIPVIAESILKQIEARVKNTNSNQLSDEDLLALHSIFGVTLQRSLEILEKHPKFIIYTNPKGRTLIEVQGDNGRCYRVFPKINFCPCIAFKNLVIERKTEVTCKHVLAARLAQILERTIPHSVTHDQYLMLLKSMFDLTEENG